MLDIFELQKKLAAVAMPSGFEKPQAELLAELARPFVDEVFTDTLGNVICHKKGPGKKVMIPAHMDVIGLMITFVDDRGFLRFEEIGGHRPYQLIGQTVRLESGVCGSIWPDADAGLDEKALSALDSHDFYIDIGASSREEAEKLAPIGSVCVFDATTQRIAGGNILTPYADDLTGCIALLLAMEQIRQPKNDLYFVFTVQEEVGLRGAVPAAFRIQPDLGIAVDVCSTGDNPELEGFERNRVRIGAGPAIKIKDGAMQTNRQALLLLRKVAEQAGIPYQNEIMLRGGTDARAMQKSRALVLSGAISIPCRNIHGQGEIVNLQDVELTGKLIAALAENEI